MPSSKFLEMPPLASVLDVQQYNAILNNDTKYSLIHID
uniref:Uncharacterized protein n=1 Tax=Arundo donax TaxID=35708 RepID=A0A0A9CDA9_ARUDO